MVEVSGAFCPNAEQDCLEHLPDYLKDRRRSERCQRYRDPSRCLSTERPHLHFCIDRFEWPNQEGALPRVLTSWTQARALCEGVGKRLCSESEWLFACEGEQSLPYTYGFIRDPTRCVFDRLTPGGPRRALKTWARCKQDATCWAEFKRLDQREPAGSFPDCISPFGVFDMNGNVNEWVWADSATRYPERSGLKGGWWGPVRDRCRPTVLFHKEDDWGYEVGFRCCQDAL